MAKSPKEFKVGDLHHWAGYRNSDTGKIDGGYLYFVESIDKNGMTLTGKSIRNVSNRSQAIKKYQEILKVVLLPKQRRKVGWHF